MREGSEWLESVLVLPDAVTPIDARAKALSAFGWLRFYRLRPEESAVLYDEALELRRALGDPEGSLSWKPCSARS